MKTKTLTATAVFAALTAVFAQIIIPLPFTPVPFSMGIFAVYLTGAILPKKTAVYAQVVYLLLGAFGLPVFGGFRGGFGALIGPTGGYLIVYPLMAFLVAWIVGRFGKKSFASLAVGMLTALAVCYLGGSLWFCVVGHVDWAKSVMLTVLPFIPMDLVKIVICSLLGVALDKALSKAGLLPAAE